MYQSYKTRATHMITDFPDPAANDISSEKCTGWLTHTMAEKDISVTFQPRLVNRGFYEPISRTFTSNLSDLLVSVGEFIRVNPIQDEQSLR
jgi:hypothetical protein